jgi:TonB family protein
MTGHTPSGLFAAPPPGRRSWAAVATSALVHAVMLGGLAALARIGPAPAPSRDHRPLTFVMTTPLPVPHEPTPALRLRASVLERAEPERRASVDVAMPETPPPAPKPVAHSDPAPAPPEPAVQARPVLAPAPAPARMPPPVTVGLFAESARTVPETQPVKAVRDAGFDTALPAARAGESKSGAVVGAFDASSATAPGKTARPAEAVASAGFGSSRADGAVTRQVADVRPSGFDAVRPAAAPARATPPPERVDIPVEILFKPVPVYTEEARQLKLEGDVLLDVEFVSTGVVSVRQVVRGLGHGLDESAATAARQIRFKPALSAGRPISFRTTVHIVFRLA